MKYELNVYKCKLVKESNISFNAVADSNCALEILENFGLRDASEEYMYLICLDAKGNATGVHEISHGDLCSTLIHPREVFKRAVLNNAAGIIIAHNHPSGDCTASDEDILSTRRIMEASKILGIQLVDHIIIGYDSHLSLRAEGLIP